MERNGALLKHGTYILHLAGADSAIGGNEQAIFYSFCDQKLAVEFRNIFLRDITSWLHKRYGARQKTNTHTHKYAPLYLSEVQTLIVFKSLILKL